MHIRFFPAAALVGVLMATSANAAVTYSVSLTPKAPGDLSGSFSLVTPNLINAPLTRFEAASLKTCATSALTCNSVIFINNNESPFGFADTILFYPLATSGVALYFNTSAFNGIGVYNEITGIAQLSVAQDVAAVPEPATWTMMIAGIGLAGTALRRRKASALVSLA